MSPLVPLVPLVALVLSALVPLTAASLTGLPPATFQLRAADWLLGGYGLITESSAVYRTLPDTSLCDCMTQCFVDINCVSLSFMTNSSGDCRLNSQRGNPQNTQYDANVLHRIRPQLAVLGDWCELDADCSLLISGSTSCVENACRCSVGHQASSPRECRDENNPSTTQTTTASLSTIAATEATTTIAPLTTTTQPVTTATPAATTTTATTPATTTTATTTTATTTTPTTTTPTTTTPTTTTPTTTTPTTTTPTTTTPTTTTPTTTTPTTTTTTAAPERAGMTKPDGSDTDTEGEFESEYEHTWACNSDDTGTSVLIGLNIGGKDLDHIHGSDCGDFSTMRGFSLDHSRKTYVDVTPSATVHRCPENQVVVAFLDEHEKAHSVDRILCVPVSGGYEVDCDQSESHDTFEKDEDTYCQTGYAVVEIARSDEISMQCCRVVKKGFLIFR